MNEGSRLGGGWKTNWITTTTSSLPAVSTITSTHSVTTTPLTTTSTTLSPITTNQKPTTFPSNSWIGHNVIIRGGKFVGQIGNVMSLSSGKFQVQIGHDVINKRADQLDLYSSNGTMQLQPMNKPPRQHNKSSSPSLIGSWVRILNGKFGGCSGFVSKGGNGYFAVEIQSATGELSTIVMKRSSELVILTSGIATSSPTLSGGVLTQDDVCKAAAILLKLMRRSSPSTASSMRRPSSSSSSPTPKRCRLTPPTTPASATVESSTA